MTHKMQSIGGIVLAVGSVWTAVLLAASAPSPAALQRGETAFVVYCAMCHGELGNGNGPLAADFQKKAHIVPLRLNDAKHLASLGRERVAEIIFDGGSHSGRSNLMPPWGEKLGRPLVADITDYVFTLPDRVVQAKASQTALDRTYFAAPKGTAASGRKLFAYYCALCHGGSGKGDGIYADTVFVRHGVRPRDLTDHAYLSTRTDKDLYTVITLGGMRTDKSPDMPTWDLQLSPARTKDLVQYIRALSRTKSVP